MREWAMYWALVAAVDKPARSPTFADTYKKAAAFKLRLLMKRRTGERL